MKRLCFVNLHVTYRKEMIQSRGQPSALPQAPQRTIDSGSAQNDSVDNSYFNEFSLDETEDHNRLSNEFESDKDGMCRSIQVIKDIGTFITNLYLQHLKSSKSS